MHNLYNGALDARLKTFASRVLSAYRQFGDYRDHVSLALSWLLAVTEFTQLEDSEAADFNVRQRLESREAWSEGLPDACIDLVWGDGQSKSDLQLKVIREAADAALEYSASVATQDPADPLPLVWELGVEARTDAFSTPLHPSLADLLVLLSEPQTLEKILDPVLCPGDYSGVLPTLLGRAGHHVYLPTDPGGTNLRVRLLNAIDKLGGRVWEFEILSLDGVKNAPQQRMRVVGMMTFGAKGWHAAQRLGIPSAFYHEHYTGRTPVEVVAIDYFARFSGCEATLLVPPLFTFGRGQMAALRHEFIQARQIESIIQLPSGSLAQTGIAPIALHLSSDGNERIFMADLEGDDSLFETRRRQLTIKNPRRLESDVLGRQESKIAKLVNYEEISENDEYLIPSRYINSVDIKNSVALGDLVSIIRAPTPLRSIGQAKADEIGISQLSYDGWGPLEGSGKRVQVDVKRLEDTRLRQYDVLLSIKGTVGKTGIITQPSGSETVPYVLANSCVALRVPSDRSPDLAIALFMFLRSTLGQRQIEALSAGGMIKQLTLATLRSEYQVPQFSAERLAQCREAFEQLLRLEADIADLVTQQTRVADSLGWEA